MTDDNIVPLFPDQPITEPDSVQQRIAQLEAENRRLREFLRSTAVKLRALSEKRKYGKR